MNDWVEPALRLFRAACALPPAERSAFLDRACAADRDLRQHVEAMIAADVRAEAAGDRTTTHPVRAALAAIVDTAITGAAHDEPVPTTIAGYRIVRLIAHGGMGTIYEAQQDHPRRRVAIKLARTHDATAERLQRFELEAQLLARLGHPGIARIIEAGATPGAGGARPFLVMEFVEGRPLTAYADEQQLSLRERMALAARVAAIVGFAHRQGVVHRDLKPDNVLVERDGAPKVLDFGVAKVEAAGGFGAATLRTEAGRILGTLGYMAPEQLRGETTGLSTAADVYSLGVMLYELLAGRLPHELDGVPLTQAVAVVSNAEALPLGVVRPDCRGDVEAVVGKALEKAARDRYVDASALQADLERWLRDEPVAARRHSTWHRARKFARRHPGLVAGTAATLVTLVAGLVTTAIGFVRAEENLALAKDRERDLEATTARLDQALLDAKAARDAESGEREKADLRAREQQQVADFQAAQLRQVDPGQMGANLQSLVVAELRAALARQGFGAADLEARLAPVVELLAQANFTNVALDALRTGIFDPSLAAIEGQFRQQPLVMAQLLQSLAIAMREVGLLEASTTPQQRALAIRKEQLGEDHEDTLESLANYGALLYALRRPEAERCARDSMAGAQRLFGADDPRTLAAMNNLAVQLEEKGALEESEQLSREVLVSMRRVQGDRDPNTLTSICGLGVRLCRNRKYDEGLQLLREAVDGRRAVLGNDAAPTLTAVAHLGQALLMRGDFDQAEPLLREGAEGKRRALGDDHHETLVVRGVHGVVLQKLDRLAEAESCLSDVLERMQRVFGDDDPRTGVARYNLGLVLGRQGKVEPAKRCLRLAVEWCRRVHGDGHPDTLHVTHSMGLMLLQFGEEDLAEAEQCLRAVVAGFGNGLGPDHASTLRATIDLARALQARGDHEAADRCFRDAESRLLANHERAAPAGDGPGAASEVATVLVHLYEVWGRPESAAQWRGRLDR